MQANPGTIILAAMVLIIALYVGVRLLSKAIFKSYFEEKQSGGIKIVKNFMKKEIEKNGKVR